MKFLAMMFLFSFLLFDFQAAEIIFRDEAKISTQWIRLTDIAKIKGKSKEETSYLEEVFLGETPPYREQKILTNTYLKRRLEQFGFWGASHRVVLPPSGIQIHRSNMLNRLKETELEVLSLLEKHYSHFSKVSLEIEDPDSLLRELPSGMLSVSIVDKEFLPNVSQKVFLMLEITAGEKTIRSRFPAHVHLFKKEIRTIRRLVPRLPIEPHQVEFAEVEIFKDHKEGYTNLEEVIGRKVSHLIPTETRLEQGNVLPPILIAKGARVELAHGDEVLKIHLYGKALEEGYDGDNIKFEMPSGLQVKGKVTGKNKGTLLNKHNQIETKHILIGGAS